MKRQHFILYCSGVLSVINLATRQWMPTLDTEAVCSISIQVALYSRPLPQHFDGHDIATVFALKGCASLVTQLCQQDLSCNNDNMQRCFYP